MPRSKPHGWPRYMIVKRTKNQGASYYWNVPTWARKKGCQLSNEALGGNYAVAKQRCDDLLNPQLDAWRQGSEPAPPRNITGTMDWMMAQFRDSKQFRDLAPSSMEDYDYTLGNLADYRLKDGRRLGNMHLASVTPGVADLLYEALEKPVEEGGRKRTRSAVKAMVVARRAWNVAYRKEPKIVPSINPFSKMELKYKAEETRRVRYEELLRLVDVADARGQASIGTAMMISFFWLMREEDVLKRLTWSHYRPADEPDIVKVFHHKTRQLVDVPLYDEEGLPLWPELMKRLDTSPRYGPVITTREKLDRDRKVHLPWGKDYFRHQVAEIRKAAGLPREVKFLGLRHGGNTEAADAGLSDAQMRALSGHLTNTALLRYAQGTLHQRREGARLRRDARTKKQRKSE